LFDAEPYKEDLMKKWRSKVENYYQEFKDKELNKDLCLKKYE
jgi:hypothetical protein